MAREVRTVYVVEDDAAVRDALALLLRSAGMQVRAFASPLEFLADYRPGGAECLLLDLRLPRLSGLEVQDRLNRRGARIPVIFLTGHGEIPLAVEAMRNGALDFLVKPFDEERLIARVRSAFDGGVPLRPARGLRLRNIAALSDRERQVLERILDGKTNAATAKELRITPKGIEYHRARIMKKLRVDSAAELFRFCLGA